MNSLIITGPVFTFIEALFVFSDLEFSALAVFLFFEQELPQAKATQHRTTKIRHFFKINYLAQVYEKLGLL